MDRGYLGAAKLSGAYEPDGKISAVSQRDAVYSAPHDETPSIHSAHANHGDECVTNCQNYDIPFSNFPAILPATLMQLQMHF